MRRIGPGSRSTRRLTAPGKRNILFIVADDLNSWIGALGRQPDVQTPNIDALANHGVLFTHAYCSAPYCNASRMSVFTGCLPSTTGVYSNQPYWDNPDRRPTFIQHLRKDGYHAFGAGKVFHGAFDYEAAGRTGAVDATWKEIENRLEHWDGFVTNDLDPLPEHRPLNQLVDFRDFEAVRPPYYAFDWGPLPDEREGDLPDGKVAVAVNHFLANDPPQPFFCAAGLYKPHLPWHVPRRFFDLYDKRRLSLPLVKNDDLDDVPRIARRWALSPPDHRLITSHGQWRDAVLGYLAAISYCDHIVGEITAGLTRSGLADSTTVILWGDNGFHLGEKLHWRKFVLWEEATLVPLIIALPEDERNADAARVHEPVSLMDLHPTILDLCGLPRARAVDGESLAPLMGPRPHRRTRGAVMTWGKGNDSVRTSEWRFTRYRDGSTELYDHKTDPFEWTNLAPNPRYSEICRSLAKRLPPTTPPT
jgi:arylsulfatase A-like enzyme